MTYQLAHPRLDIQEGIEAILDAAMMHLDFDEDGTPADPGLFAGFELALGSILSADEMPAALLIMEACAGTRQAR